jgi:hypothetical protein
MEKAELNVSVPGRDWRRREWWYGAGWRGWRLRWLTGETTPTRPCAYDAVRANALSWPKAIVKVFLSLAELGECLFRLRLIQNLRFLVGIDRLWSNKVTKGLVRIVGDDSIGLRGGGQLLMDVVDITNVYLQLFSHLALC